MSDGLIKYKKTQKVFAWLLQTFTANLGSNQFGAIAPFLKSINDTLYKRQLPTILFVMFRFFTVVFVILCFAVSETLQLPPPCPR